MTPHVIEFSPEGTAQAMHNDELSLGFLGPQIIERASEIKFNEKTQRWGIWLAREDCRWATAAPDAGFNPPAEGADGFGTYDGARTAEVAWLNQCRAGSVAPDSRAGLIILAGVRRILKL